MVTKLCARCEACIQGKTRRSADISVHHESFTSLMIAVETGCYFCRELLTRLSEVQRLELVTIGTDEANQTNAFSHLSIETPEKDAYGGGSDSLRLHIMLDPAFSERLQAIGRQSASSTVYPALFIELHRVKSLNSWMLIDPTSSSIDSAESWGRARQWIERWVATHTACSSKTFEEYPSRLLEISHIVEGPPNVRVVVPSEDDLAGPYATLSHCWGDVHTLTLQKSNLTHMRQSVAWDDPSLTFKEAIKVTIKLQIRYLWIDSLCILQEETDLTEWLAEAPRMERYYGNAFINIAATASENGSQGLYRTRNPATIRHQRVKLPRIYGRPPGEYVVSNLSQWDGNLDEAVLNSRGWVLQERMLARRILHFSQEQLFWECCEMSANEMYPFGLPESEALQERNLFKDVNPASSRNRHRYEDVAAWNVPYILWERVKKEYSQCHLTMARDKTVAILGIANQFAAMLNDEYIAGMWRTQLPHQLLWRITSSQYPSTHELTSTKRHFPVPAWSWLSANSPVDNNVSSWLKQGLQNELLIEILDVQAADAMESASNPASSSFLRTLGVPIQCEIEMADNGLLYVHTEFFGMKRMIRNNWPFLDRIQDSLQVKSDRCTCYYLPVRLSHSASKGDDWKVMLEGILLRPTDSGESSPTYYRIGYMSVDDKDANNIVRMYFNKGNKRLFGLFGTTVTCPKQTISIL